jgi:hypothetical protein
MIDERDEWLHEVENDLAWQESFRFNWAPGLGAVKGRLRR